MAQNNALRTAAERARRLDEISFAQRKNLAAKEPGVAGPTDQAKRENNVIETGTEDGGKRDGEQDAGKCHQNIDQAHEHLIDPATEVTGKGADHDADGERKGDGRDPDQKGNA